MILQKLVEVCSALVGVELGLLQLEFVVLTTGPQRGSNCHHPTRTQTQHGTCKESPYSHIFYPPFQSSKFQILTLTPGNGLHSHLASFIHWVGRARGVWLIVWQLLIKAGWRDAPLMLRKFSQSNKHQPQNKNIQTNFYILSLKEMQ